MRAEFPGYVAVSAGMALAASSYAMLGGLFGIVDGLWTVVAITVAGAFCALVSASIGELAAMFPSAPGVRTYLRAAFGNYASLAVLFLYLAMVAMATGVEAHVVTSVIGDVFPAIPRGAAVLFVFTLVVGTNLRGLEVPRTLQLGMTLVLVLSTLLIGASALFAEGAPSAAAPHPLSAEALNLPAAIGTAIFLFMGFEWVTPMGRSPSAYRRAIPLSMLCAIAILITVYATFAAGMAHRLGAGQYLVNPIPQVAMGAAAFGEPGRYAIAILSILAMSTCLNAGLMGASRLMYALAREGVLPAWSTTISRSGVPVYAIASVGALTFGSAMLVMFTGTYKLAGVTVAAIECFVYAALAAAVLRLRQSRPNASRSFRNPLPTSAQWLIALALPFLGIASLASVATMRFVPAALLIVLAAIAALGAYAAIGRTAKPYSSTAHEGAKP
jgi:ethanolamine permease